MAQPVPTPDRLTLTRPDDWHLHVRDGPAMESVIAHTARVFARAIIMPNLDPPVTTADSALAYRQRILDALPQGSRFDPLMTLYLTDATTPGEIEQASRTPHVVAAKLYPAGATTHSASGVTDLRRIRAVLQAMEQTGLPLLVHGEVTDTEVDIFDRERVFLEDHLAPLVKQFPGLRVVVEHITTREAVDFVRSAPANVAATITPHHLVWNRNRLLAGGIRPHAYCLPVVKRESHRKALLDAAMSGESRFFLGTDSAPHSRRRKESTCGCAGIYSAHAAMELYAEVFEDAGCLDRLEGFAGRFGPDFYGLPRNRETITMVRQEWTIPDEYSFGNEQVVPMGAGERLRWRVE